MDNQQIAMAFAFGGQNIRVVLGQDGQPWFVARDVALVLGYAKPENAIAAHCKAPLKQGIPSTSGIQLTTIIPERDVYRLVMRSKLPAAERFEEWVVGEVLPSIRKTGRYELPTASTIPAIPQTFAQALRLAAEQAETIEVQARQIAAAKPAIAFTEAVADMTDCIKIGALAKTLGHGPNKLFARLRVDGILMASNLPYQEYLDRGYFKVIEREPWKDSSGEKHPSLTTMVTGKGQVWLARRYPPTAEVLKAAKARRKAGIQ